MIDQMTQEAIGLLMRSSPRHAKHIEIILERLPNDEMRLDLQSAAKIIQDSRAENLPTKMAHCNLADRLLFYASKLSPIP